MYKNYVDSIKFTDKKRLIFIPLGVAFLTYLSPTIFQLLFNIIFPAPIEQVGSLPAALAIVTTVFLALYSMKKISKLEYTNLGIIKKSWFKQFLIGEFGGGLLLCLVACIIWVLGGTVIKINTTESAWGAMFIGLIFFLFQGTWEEIMYRAYLMPHFSKVMGDFWAMVITSLLFTLGHALNPGMQALPILNLFVASLVFSMIYRYTGSLIIIGVGHGLWNYTQGFIFGAEVSGHSISFSTFTSTAVKSKELISGGSFGFEGGLVTTVIGILLIILFSFLIKKKK